MNISPLLPQVNSLQNVSLTQQVVTQHYYEENTNLNLTLTGQNDIINLSLSSSMTYLETTYNEKGVIAGQPQNNFGDTSILSGGITETNEAISKTNTLVDNVMGTYLELLRDRVEYLLKQITDNIQEKSTLSGINKSNTITDLLDFSPEKTAGRILDFALSFYDGGDRQEFAAMAREAVMKGFNEAMKAFGGSLPRECHETIRIVNAALDDFAGGGSIDFSV